MQKARRSLIGGYSGGVEGEMIIADMLINLGNPFDMEGVKGLDDKRKLKNGEQHENPNSDSCL